ncbi:MAG: tryptophan-rich sensory protein, partial [Bacteroidota bacterium]|nr:tryptophan-rich sensory protein [Bacteroidota bacterium]
MKTKSSWWQVLLATVAVSALGALSTGLSKGRERKLYNRQLKQAPWAPPAWVFGPAWSINNFFLLHALRDLLRRDDIPQKKKLLIQQALIWIIFFSFGYVYFQKKSPLLAAVWTLADALLAGNSFWSAYKANKTLGFKYLPLLGWTSYAGTVAVFQALKNDDPLL